MRRTHLLEAHVRAQLVRKRTTKEGEVITYHQEELQVGGDGEMFNKILLFWPTTIVHKITPESPLYNIIPEELNPLNNSFEIIVVLEGIVESTGLPVQARSSYLPCEVRFANIISFMHDNNSIIVTSFIIFVTDSMGKSLRMRCIKEILFWGADN